MELIEEYISLNKKKKALKKVLKNIDAKLEILATNLPAFSNKMYYKDFLFLKKTIRTARIVEPEKEAVIEYIKRIAPYAIEEKINGFNLYKLYSMGLIDEIKDKIEITESDKIDVVRLGVEKEVEIELDTEIYNMINTMEVL